MKIINNASFAVIAFGWHNKKGYGDDVTIEPGSSAEVNGPYIGEMDNVSCFVCIPGKIICQETPDSGDGYEVRIELGFPVTVASRDKGITIRHHSEPPEDYVVNWRRSNKIN